MLRQILILFLFLSIRITFGEDLKIITSGGLQGIADEHGEVLIPPIYEILGWSDGKKEIVEGTIGFRESGRWGLLNIRNGKAGSAEFIVLKPFEGSLFEAGIKGRLTNLIFHGLIDRNAKVNLDFRFFSIENIGDHRIIVSEYSNSFLNYGLYTDDNERVIPVEYASLTLERDIIVASSKEQKKRLFDLNGRLLVPEWVDGIYWNGDGYVISIAGKRGFLNETGQLLHDLDFKGFSGEDPQTFSEWTVVSRNDKRTKMILCDSIRGFEGDLLIAHVNNVEHILSASGVLFADEHLQLKHIDNGFVITKNTVLGSWGIFKTDGKEVAAGFDSIAVDSSYFFAKEKNGWQVYNFFGRRINDHPFQAVSYSQAGALPVKRTDYWGLVDFQGDQLVSYKFDKLLRTNTSSHFAANYLNKWGVISINDRWIIMPEYDSLYAFQDLYVASKGAATYVFDSRGNLRCRVSYDLVADGLLKVYDQGMEGVVTSTGLLIHPVYEQVRLLNGYYELRTGPVVRLVDADGGIIIEEADGIEKVLGFSEGYFLIRKDGKYGFVDENGKLRIANRYEAALPYDEGLAPVMLLGKWGYIDKSENLIIQPFYSSSGTFVNNLSIIRTGNHYGLINKEGEEVIQPEWKAIERLGTGNYLITDSRDKVGLANQSGRFLIRPDYDALLDTSESLIIATRAGRKGILDYTGLTRVPLEYAEVKVTGGYVLLKK